MVPHTLLSPPTSPRNGPRTVFPLPPDTPAPPQERTHHLGGPGAQLLGHTLSPPAEPLPQRDQGEMYSPARRPFRGRHPSLAGLGVPAARGQVVHRGRAPAGLRGPGRGGCRLGATRTPVWTPTIVPSGTPGWAQHHAGTCGWTHRDGRGGRTAGSARSPRPGPRAACALARTPQARPPRAGRGGWRGRA